jgi:DNA replication protein DnaC
MTTTVTPSRRDVASEPAGPPRPAAPALRDAASRLAERAQAGECSFEEHLAACLQREIAARDAHGAESRISVGRFTSRKSLEDFDLDHRRSVKREMITHMGTLDVVAGKENVICLCPLRPGKTHLATGRGIRACQAGHRVAFAATAEWVPRLAKAPETGRLDDELARLGLRFGPLREGLQARNSYCAALVAVEYMADAREAVDAPVRGTA